MATMRYAIMNCDGEWRVVGERRRIGRHLTCEAAMLAGARLALEAMREGHEVEFLVQNESHELTRHDPKACIESAMSTQRVMVAFR